MSTEKHTIHAKIMVNRPLRFTKPTLQYKPEEKEDGEEKKEKRRGRGGRRNGRRRALSQTGH
jgi:hypothetical protein